MPICKHQSKTQKKDHQTDTHNILCWQPRVKANAAVAHKCSAAANSVGRFYLKQTAAWHSLTQQP
jgi:hypothetical protein